MKTLKFFAMLAASAAFTFTACTEKEPDTPDNQETPTEEVGTKAELTAFTLVAGGESLEGTVSGDEVGIYYTANQFEALQNATATATVSEGATIEPDPATARDYTVEGGVTFTVTSEDGKTSNEYNIVLVEAIPVLTASMTWEKTAGELGLPAYAYNNVGIAFSGNNIVTYDGQVFDLTGAPVGKLNLTGVDGASDPDFQLAALTNDNTGVLVASVGLDADGNYITGSDNVKQTRYYAWMDGYDQDPTLILSSDANLSVYMAVGGDVKGEAVLSIVSTRVVAPQMHNIYYVTDGNWENKQWTSVWTQYAGNDGNWGQMLSYFTGDPRGAFVMCDSRGNNEGMMVAYYENSDDSGTPGAETILYGTCDPEYGGTDLYGNYSMGSAKALNIDGTYYVVAATTGWTAVYLTIQPTNTVDDYILPTATFTGSQVFASSGAYYDKEAGVAYVALLSPGNEIVLYTLEVQYV